MLLLGPLAKQREMMQAVPPGSHSETKDRAVKGSNMVPNGSEEVEEVVGEAR